MTIEEFLEESHRVCEAATEFAWVYDGSEEARYINAARTAFPQALEIIKRLRQELNNIRGVCLDPPGYRPANTIYEMATKALQMEVGDDPQ